VGATWDINDDLVKGREHPSPRTRIPMLVSHRKHFIYTKTLKTAGTSVEVYFEPYCFPEGEWIFSHDCDEYVSETGIVGCRGRKRSDETWFNHMSAKAIKKQLGNTLWRDYFKFCVIRNPFDKLVSAFHFYEYRFDQHQERFPRARRLNGQQAQFLDAIRNKSPIERFRLWIEWGGGLSDRKTYLINGKLCMDYFIRFESLQADIQEVCNRLDIPFEPEKIMQLKSGTRPEEYCLDDYYDAKTIAIVSQQYDLELKHFGYELPR